MPQTLTPRRPWSSDDDLPPLPPVPPRRTGGGGEGGGPPRPPRRRPVAALVLAGALVGGGGSAAVLAATGSLGGGRTEVRTVTQTVTSPAADRTAAAGALDAAALYAAASPGVVSITAQGVSSDESAPVSPFGGPEPQQGSGEATATGTGFFYDTDGHILTAAHVVSGASSITITMQDGTKRTAELLGSDDATDVAVLKIDPSGLDLTALELGSSAGLKIGDEIAAIGDPFGYQRSISTGVASGLDRTIEAPNGFTVAHAVQTDAALNPGNSGGPLLDASGQVIGIVDQIATGSSGAEQSSGVGFAVPIDLVAKEVATLEQGGQVRHAYIGLSTADAATTTTGAVVATVVGDGPAAAAGLRQGDVITDIGGTAIEGANDLVAAVGAHRPGESVAVTLRRDGTELTRTVTLGTQPAQTTGG